MFFGPSDNNLVYTKRQKHINAISTHETTLLAIHIFCWFTLITFKLQNHLKTLDLKFTNLNQPETQLQWGFEIQTNLDFENGQNEVGLQMVQIWNGSWNHETEPFEIRKMAASLSKTIWNLDKNVSILNVPVLERLGLKL